MKSVHFTLCCLPRKDSSHSRGGSTRSSASDTRLSTEGCKHFYRASAVKRVLARSAICYGSVSVRPSVCHKPVSYQTVSTCHHTNKHVMLLRSISNSQGDETARPVWSKPEARRAEAGWGSWDGAASPLPTS